MEPTSISTGPAILKGTTAFERLDEHAVSEIEAYTLGVQAVMWGMQWVKGGEALRLFSEPLANGATPSQYDPRAHGITWGHARMLLNADTRLIETPNTETLYSMACVDLRDSPVVIVHPSFGDRYFRTSIWELHGDTHTISQRQDGSAPPPYALVPVSWMGELPAGVKRIDVRSRYVQIAPHLAVYGEADLPNVHALQDGFKLYALRDFATAKTELAPGQPMRPIRRTDSETPPELAFFEELCETLKDITIREDERAFARQLRSIGITLSEGFQPRALDAPRTAGLQRALLDAQTVIAHKTRTLVPAQPGGTWQLGLDMTSLDDWLFRAATGFGYVWGDAASEILFPMARMDENGAPLTGANHYVLHFPKGQLPPARYFRISIYDPDGFFFHNPINRYGIGNMAETLTPDPDDGLTIRIQHHSPGAILESNWLPAPASGFFLVMRLYQPDERLYRGDYVVPPVRKVA